MATHNLVASRSQDAVALNNAMSNLDMQQGDEYDDEYGEGEYDADAAGVRLRQPLDASQLDDEYDDEYDQAHGYGGDSG
eukprot:2076848-Prymnesium_polylepis.1